MKVRKVVIAGAVASIVAGSVVGGVVLTSGPAVNNNPLCRPTAIAQLDNQWATELGPLIYAMAGAESTGSWDVVTDGIVLSSHAISAGNAIDARLKTCPGATFPATTAAINQAIGLLDAG
jgi:hypothetical protein